MLVVKPNPRRMRQFRDSPAENALAGTRGNRFVRRVRWERVFLVAAIAGVVVLGLIELSPHLKF